MNEMTRSDDERPILVTGATGNTGREVVRALLERGQPVRAASRSAEPVRAAYGDAVQAVALDVTSAESWSAVGGARAMFLLRPSAVSNTRATLVPLIDRAVAEGVEHIAFLSVAGADQNRIVPHAAVEAHLARAEIGYTLLRPGFFAQNLADAYRDDIARDNRLYVPAGPGRVAFVDLRDVADVAADALVDPATHCGAAYTLTGPLTATFEQVADALTAALGRRIRYERASVLGYAMHLRRRGFVWGQIAVQTILHIGLRLGQAERVDPTLERLLGRTPRSIFDYVRDCADVWRRPDTRSR